MKHRFAVVLLTLSLGTAGVMAQPASSGTAPMPEGHPRRPMMRERMMEELNLTDQQKLDIAKLRATFEKKMIAQRAKVQSLRVDLRTEVMADNPGRSAIEKTTQAISELQAQGKMDLIDHLFSVRALLTPDQQKHMKRQLGRLVDEFQGMKGKHGGWGAGMMRHSEGEGK